MVVTQQIVLSHFVRLNVDVGIRQSRVVDAWVPEFGVELKPSF